MKKILFLLIVIISFSSCSIFQTKRNRVPIGYEKLMGKYFDANGRRTPYKPKNKKEKKEYKDIVRQMKEDKKTTIKKEGINYH